MMSRERSRFVLSVCVAAAILAGCGGSQPPIGEPGSLPQTAAVDPLHSSRKDEILLRFDGRDGREPESTLISVDNALYGTTVLGGKHDLGTAFNMTTSNAEKVLHDFKGYPTDGSDPVAGLLSINGTLYGTSLGGGAYLCTEQQLPDCGTIFSIDSSGQERVLHSFGETGDGFRPEASLIYFKRRFYGTTAYGGAHDGGTVFSITVEGSEKVLYSFGGDSDGAIPYGNLVEANGTFYGTTSQGGGTTSGVGRGTIYSVSRSGFEQVLYRFGGAPDGATPLAGLVNIGGVLYGTTAAGGAYGDGTIFSITPSGYEHILHSFGSRKDGKEPMAALVNAQGTLYGTTLAGGVGGNGTIFSVSTSGIEHLLHSFRGRHDGSEPRSGLLYANSLLYGATTYGLGKGVVYSIAP
jgi:uncharacterized repeat protein (TIGR03803 family)